MSNSNRNINNNLCTETIRDFSELERIRNMVNSCAQKYGFDEKTSFKMALAVDEACSNLIKYTILPADDDKYIQIQISQKSDMMQIIIFDEAEAFDPNQIDAPNMSDYFKEYRKGGLGIHLIKLIMDDISYIPRSKENNFNTLILSKKIIK